MKIVVFGAGGFIGGWLCVELAHRKDIDLVACVRNWSSAVRLARSGIDVIQVDLETVSQYTSVISDADVVVNASAPSPDREPEIASRLYTACAVAGVRKFVQFSSIAVYGDQTGKIDEDAPLSPSGHYGRGKAQMEAMLLDMADGARPQLFILRPAIVYGPFSGNWTVRYAHRIAEGRWRSLGWAGQGHCNLVHGQDVARAVILATQAPPDLESHILNINGPEVVTWNDYIDRFGDALGVSGRTNVDPIVFSLTSTGVHGVRQIGSWLKRSRIRRRLQDIPGLVGRAQSVVDLYPTPDELHLLRQEVQYSWERATRVIGFNPSVSLDDGLQQSAKWCRAHGVIS